MLLEVNDIDFQYNALPILNHITFGVERGQVVGIVGPNGSGKSTLLQVISRTLTPTRGEVFIDHQLITRISPRELARQISVVRQQESCAFDFTVAEVVMMGRLPYLGPFGRETETDLALVEKAMAAAGIQDLAQRSVLELSGGEFQRVALARALAQDTPLLLLDEPTSSLDLKYQMQVLQLLEHLVQAGRAVLVTIHDLNLASQFCHRLMVLSNGCIRSIGTPCEVLTTSMIHEVYGIPATIAAHPVTGKPYVYPHFS